LNARRASAKDSALVLPKVWCVDVWPFVDGAETEVDLLLKRPVHALGVAHAFGGGGADLTSSSTGFSVVELLVSVVSSDFIDCGAASDGLRGGVTEVSRGRAFGIAGIIAGAGTGVGR